MTIPSRLPNCCLIVEGSDDLHTVIHLTTRHGMDWDNKANRIQIKDTKGVVEALKIFPIIIKSTDRAGIILDADINLSSRWQSICDRLKDVAKELDIPVDLPKTPEASGTIIEFGNRRIGIWLMPDNEQSGKLEDFLERLIPENDCCWTYAAHATEEAHCKGADFSELDTIKAQIHTWLAWQKKPGLPFGSAIKAAYFSHDTPEALAFVAWFKRLFF